MAGVERGLPPGCARDASRTRGPALGSEYIAVGELMAGE